LAMLNCCFMVLQKAWKSLSLILTDIKMPDISGDQILAYLRNKMKKSTPVIGMSGTPWLLEDKGFYAVLEKPYLMPEMFNLISKLLEKSTSSK
jgi:CheY-like chemotaxis protein